jgi:hypothetical protein
MAIDANLQQFKSSGVYRLTFDKSQTAQIPAETIRLVVGFSKKGPFNTPIFVPDPEFFINVFGNIDRTLERKGSFFHRTALNCLDRGPIIVLNLLSLDDNTDKTEFISFATAPDQTNKAVASAPLSGWFNTDKFWYLDADDAFTNVKTVYPTPHLLNFCNVGRKKVSILTRKADVTGFDITAKEWFGAAELPEFMNESDLISDYMVEVLVVEGDYSNYTQLDTDPVFGDYFDTNGLKKTYTDAFGTQKDGITAFINLPEVKVLGKYVGSIIPDFVDKNGANLFIEDLVNLESVVTGIQCAIDKDAFDDGYVSGDKIDLIGHVVESEDVSSIDFLSYYGTIKADRVYDEQASITSADNAVIGATASSVFPSPGPTSYAKLTASPALQADPGYTSGTHFDTITLYSLDSSEVNSGQINSPFTTDAEFTSFVNAIAAGKSYVSCSAETAGGATVSPTHARVKSVSATTDSIALQIEITTEGGAFGYSAGTTGNHLYLAEDDTIDIIPQLDFIDAETNGTNIGLIGLEDSGLYKDWDTDIITSGDKGLMAGGTVYKPLKFVKSTLDAGTAASGVDAQLGAVLFSHDVDYVTVTPYDDADFTTLYSPGFTVGATNFTVQTLTGDLNQTISGIEDNTLDAPNVVRVSGTIMSAGDVKKGDYLVSTKSDAKTSKSRLTKVKTVAYNSSSDIYTITAYDDIWTSGATGDIEKYEGIEEFVSNYRFKALAGFTMRDAQLPNGSNDRQNEILNVMYTTNIKNTLVDRDVITFRYIIDTFNGGIEAASKSLLSNIAKDRQNAFAILNMPSVKNFKDSTDPLFKFDATSKFDARYIAEGGNQSLNPSISYGLPGISAGGNFCAFYGPNLMIRERGKNISVPPAAWVSNLYIDKFTTALPWSIIAGPRRGVVSGGGIVGLEYNFDRTDLDNIEPFGINAIVPKKGLGFVINANQTAQQGVKSALSQAHVRELIIYIQDGVEAILKNYRWEFNTAQNRLEIKTLADSFLGQILNDGGLYDFRNVMDTTNNTNEIIDANMGILDTYIEPARGMGILVHRTTILKTGTISTGNFL